MDPARLVLDEVRIWQSCPDPVPGERLVEDMEPRDRAFVLAMYETAASLYASLPRRRNGQAAFAHPTNVALFLVRAHTQAHVVAAGLLHDVLEDRMDIEKGAAAQSPRDLERLELAIRGQLGEAVVRAASRADFPRHIAERVVEVVWTLTRHKADLYYKSISGIFTHADPVIRLAAALVKLADRMHNIQTLENYHEDEQIYQCFKNIFILNNAKQLREEMRARLVDPRMAQSLEKLFKKCGKATFQALQRIDRGFGGDGRADGQVSVPPAASVFDVLTILSLALRKYMLEIKGLWSVTEGRLEPGAPVFHLYHGIVKKYDHRLHHEERAFQRQVKRELAYCRATFADLRLSDDDLHRAIQYKDAIALEEVVASLLYLDRYVIRGFQCSLLCRRNQNCLKPSHEEDDQDEGDGEGRDGNGEEE